MIQRTGERGDPCGSPAETSLSGQVNPSITSCAVRFERKEDIHLTRFWGRPASIKIWIRVGWATQSYAPLTSIKTAPATFPFFHAFSTKHISFRRASFVFRFFREPNLPSWKMWRVLQNEAVFFASSL